MPAFTTYLLSHSLAIAGGVIIGMIIDKDNVYKVTIRKIKQRGRGNVLESDLNVILPPQTKREDRKLKRNERRNKRKAKNGNK